MRPGTKMNIVSARKACIEEGLLPAIAYAAHCHRDWQFPTFGLLPGEPHVTTLHGLDFTRLDSLFHFIKDET